VKAEFGLWRFGPKVFKSLYNVPDPASIQRRAESGTPLEQVAKEWPISTDPGPHIQKIHELQEGGVSIVNIHAGQPDQQRVVEFYATRVLPHLRQPPSPKPSGLQTGEAVPSTPRQ
jgi:hypothetical protein